MIQEINSPMFVTFRPLSDAARRAWERSSSFKTTARAMRDTLWQTGKDLLAQIHGEEKTVLAAIWDAPDADEFAKKIQDANVKATLQRKLEREFAEIETTQVTVKRLTNDFFTPEARDRAKAELAALANKK